MCSLEELRTYLNLIYKGGKWVRGPCEAKSSIEDCCIPGRHASSYPYFIPPSSMGWIKRDIYNCAHWSNSGELSKGTLVGIYRPGGGKTFYLEIGKMNCNHRYKVWCCPDIS